MPVQILLAVLVPAIFGAICGWLLGVNKTAYLVLSVLALLGGYAAGTEHKSGAQGALRGLVGGALFGGLILIVNEALDKTPKASLPHPKIWLLAITVGVGVILGTLGGRARASFDESELEKEKPKFDIRRIQRSELIGFLGAAILFLSLFLNWFATSCDPSGHPKGCNPNSALHGDRGSFSAFQTYGVLDILLVAACAAPFILAYIIARGHDLTWRPGEITMIVGITAFALILVNGIILGRPGGDDPQNVDISIQVGYWVGLVGAGCIAFGGFVRQASGIRGRKPPGVL
ncbi:MAG: hypothetical protein QOE38_992 [Thermoleophilaceae bacterium]|nr:hypothetical protein [Thermoleophilaceae bacterium]